MACDETPNSRGYEQAFQHDGSGFASESLIEECQDGYEGGGGLEIVEVVHAEEERDGVEPRGDEADGDGTHDGDGDHFLGAIDFLGEVGGTIEASKGVVGVDQTDDESDPIRRPPSVIHEIGEDEFGILMRWCLRRDGD